MFDNSENHKDRKEIWREIVTTPQEETSQEFLPNTANTPSIPKVEEWEKELELGGDIFDLEGEVRPDGKEVLKELIEHLLTKERTEAYKEVLSTHVYQKEIWKAKSEERTRITAIIDEQIKNIPDKCSGTDCGTCTPNEIKRQSLSDIKSLIN